MISLLGSLKTCKADTAWAGRYQSDRFENPNNMACPVWSGRDNLGRPVSVNSFQTKAAGCNTPADRVYVENTLRPQYMEATTVDSYGFRSDLYQGGGQGFSNKNGQPVPVFQPSPYKQCPFYPYDWHDPTLPKIAVYSRHAQNIQHQTKAYDMLQLSGKMRITKTLCMTAAVLLANGIGIRGSRLGFKLIYEPRNNKQVKYMEVLKNTKYPLIIAEGPAGTGKTAFACQYGLQLLHDKRIQKLVITRPTVSSDDGIGFLRGGMQEKMTPWTAPLMDVFKEYYSKDQLRVLMEDERIEIAPISFMRGRTFKSSFVIADEMQNATPGQIKMVLTRLGEGSRMVVTGDTRQSDLRCMNGLTDLIERLNDFLPDHEMYEKGIALVRFDSSHIQRHFLLKTISELYEDDVEEDEDN